MEQQDTSAASPPPPNRRDSLPARLNDPSASLPAPASTSNSTFTSAPPPQTSLSASEPTLRFPRPLGNRRLANWVSSSNPDIMRLTTTTEDTGLSGSTYELISGANTDTESQDGNYPESISESVSSLDLRRPDDVHSLAGTETYDDESVIDESEYRPVTPDHDDEDDDDDDDEMNEDTFLGDSQVTNEPSGVQSLSESEHEALSRSSLEYTQQSLKTPSLPPSPDASRIVERIVFEPEQFATAGEETTWEKRRTKFWDIKARVEDYILEATSAALPGLIFVVAIALVLPVFYNPSALDPMSPLSTTPNAPMAAPIIATTATSQTAATHLTSDIRPHPTSTGSVGLIPVGEVASDEWRFGAKLPVVSFTAEARNDILIHIPRSVKETWLAKDCLTVTAKRDGSQVDSTTSPTDEGIVVKFPKKEMHGVVVVVLEAKCRPKVHKVVKVHFGKGIVKEAYERTKLLAHDLSGLVPAAAQEAERCIEGAKRSLGSVCQNVCLNLQTASDTVAKTFGTTFSDTRQNLENLAINAFARAKGATEEITNKIDSATQQATEQLAVVQDVQSQIELQLLDAQISAKIWWLQATGRQEEGHDYQRKAKSFVAKKQAAVEETKQARKKRQEKSTEPASRPWSKIMGKSQCQSSTDRKGRVTQQCKAAA